MILWPLPYTMCLQSRDVDRLVTHLSATMKAAMSLLLLALCGLALTHPLVLEHSQQLKNVICPDGQSECPDGNTCCKLSSGQWGCCPLPKAVCCSDHLHCCPNGYTCDVSAGTCTQRDEVIPFVKKTPAKYKNVICPDGQSECPDGNTCCQLSSGQWGCCPLPNAVCCSDHLHCCPNGYTCDVSAGTCTREDEVIPFVKKTPAKYKNVICPDGQSECPDGNTCCQLSSGQWGCCPLPNAVCCSDHLHCCPQGDTCDVSAGTCLREDEVIPFVKKTPAKYKDVVCPDGSTCPDGNTCCQLSSGGYGCCPLPNAVCCSDHLHCCPQGDTCDVSAGTCLREDEVIPFVKKTPAKYKDVVCPDGSTCPDGNTCCQLSSGGYGCCPLPNAVCCSDHLHCCPQGDTCDVSAGTCLREDEVIPFVKKTPAKYKDVVCPDGSTCPDGNTCCQLSSGGYGCCPLPNAVCCSDHLHCCPQGDTCDVSAGTCLREDEVIPFVKKTPAKYKDVVCPDGSTCPDGNTCCQLSSGGYGCCPLPNAVCCSDHLHCCPQGDTCDVSAGTCLREDEVIPFVKKTPAKYKDVVCPDQSECPDGNTCCQLSSGQWGCCPLPNAVCCSDHLHCCPNGYTCDVSAGTCTKEDEVIPFVKKTPAKYKNVVCPDQSECPDGNTCCQLSSGQYGCCPLPEAVCCSDHLHCCPEGYTCDVSAGTCTKEDEVIPFVKKTPAKYKNVICPGSGSECPDGNTCCKLSSGQWGCCPLPNAVCCSDHLHCCPEGYTCDVSAGTCTKEDEVIPFVKKTPAKYKYIYCPDGTTCPDGNTCCPSASGGYGCCPYSYADCCSDLRHCCPLGYTCHYSNCSFSTPVIPFVRKTPAKYKNVICPGGGSECPDGNTCCKLSSGQWGCCPLPNAECCSDHLHCCPNGYTCDVSAGTCTKEDMAIPFFKKLPATRRTL